MAAAGLEGWLVGGALRDHLLGRPVRDWDVVVDAPLARVVAAVPGLRLTGGRRSIAIAPSAGSSKDPGIEVSGLRRGATCLAEDLARRDFSLNAIAWDPLADRWLDPTGGRADLAARRLRAPAPDRAFADDPVRALRAARFAADLGLELEPATRSALELRAGRLRAQPPERLARELLRGLGLDALEAWLRRLRAWGVLASAYPELCASLGMPPQGSCREHPDAWACGLAAAAVLPAGDPELRLAALLRFAGLDAGRVWRPRSRRLVAGNPHLSAARRANRLARRLRLPLRSARILRARVVHVDVFRHPERCDATDAPRRVLGRIGLDMLGSVAQLERAALQVCRPDAEPLARRESALRALERELARERQRPRPKLAIDGRDVMDWLGVPEGREVGRWLARARRHVWMRPQDNSKIRLRAWLLAQGRASHSEERTTCTRS